MRRRDSYQIKEDSQKPEPVVEKGYCPKCGKKIGRGIGLHIPKCKG